MTTEGTAGIRKSNRRWQSDVIVDLVKRYGFPYVALNPGASFRGLHDSLVNYGENEPPMCRHRGFRRQTAAWLGACDCDRRNIGCAGMGLQFSAQFSEQPSAQSQHGAEGVL
jgi:hypothetical protein